MESGTLPNLGGTSKKKDTLYIKKINPIKLFVWNNVVRNDAMYDKRNILLKLISQKPVLESLSEYR